MSDDLASDLLIGAGPIAQELLGSKSQKAKRKIYHWHQLRLIPSFKWGASIAARRSTLRERVSDAERAAAANK